MGLQQQIKNTSGSDIKKIKKKMHGYANKVRIKIELETQQMT